MSLDQLIENFFRPKLSFKNFIKIIEEQVTSMTIGVSGQDNERNLVKAVNELIAANGGSPIEVNLGDFGIQRIKDATKLGGGPLEPKADVVLTTDNGEEIGVSMKKENFDFLDNRMDEAKLFKRLTDTTLEPHEAQIIVDNIKQKMAEVTQDQASIIEAEKTMFIDLMKGINPSYQFPNKISTEDMQKVVEQSNGKFILGTPKRSGGLTFKSKFNIKNEYLDLSEILEGKYKTFLRLVVAGGSDNPYPATAVLVTTIPTTITSVEELSTHLSKTVSIGTAINNYMNDPNINITFRLRPMTKTRTTYSTSNRSHYKPGERMYVDSGLGVSWTTFTIKRKTCKSDGTCPILASED